MSKSIHLEIKLIDSEHSKKYIDKRFWGDAKMAFDSKEAREEIPKQNGQQEGNVVCLLFCAACEQIIILILIYVG
jgi:hypothetical protein